MTAAQISQLAVIFVDVGDWPIALLAEPVQALLADCPSDSNGLGQGQWPPPRLEDLLAIKSRSMIRPLVGREPAVGCEHEAGYQSTRSDTPATASIQRRDRRYLQLRNSDDGCYPFIDIPTPVGLFTLPAKMIYPLPPLLAARHHLPGLRALIAGPDQPNVHQPGTHQLGTHQPGTHQPGGHDRSDPNPLNSGQPWRLLLDPSLWIANSH